jgi:hypothetical protein
MEEGRSSPLVPATLGSSTPCRSGPVPSATPAPSYFFGTTIWLQKQRHFGETSQIENDIFKLRGCNRSAKTSALMNPYDVPTMEQLGSCGDVQERDRNVIRGDTSSDTLYRNGVL